MKILNIAATAVLATALVAGGSIAASAAPADGVSTASECNIGPRLVALWQKLPAELQSDLKDLKALEPGERADAARSIREGARNGDYGTQVQDYAVAAQKRRATAWVSMPAELKADLKDLHAAAPGDRRALARTIADTALDGGYGEATQANAQKLKAELCG